MKYFISVEMKDNYALVCNIRELFPRPIAHMSIVQYSSTEIYTFFFMYHYNFAIKENKSKIEIIYTIIRDSRFLLYPFLLTPDSSYTANYSSSRSFTGLSINIPSDLWLFIYILPFHPYVVLYTLL